MRTNLIKMIELDKINLITTLSKNNQLVLKLIHIYVLYKAYLYLTLVLIKFELESKKMLILEKNLVDKINKCIKMHLS